MEDFQSLNWQVENLRLTGFPGPSTPFIQEPSWWADLMGEQPEQDVLQRNQRLLNQIGPLEPGRLVLTNQPERINWLFIPPEGISDLPIIGSFEEMLKIFLPVMVRWFNLATCPSLSRLAFAAVLLYPVDSKQAGYQQLDRLLPSVELASEGISDFSYQINRPREAITEIDGLIINRLSKWSVFAVKQFSLTVGRTSMRGSTSEESLGCRLELDINTHQDFAGEFTPAQLPEILNELVQLGREIAQRGDVP